MCIVLHPRGRATAFQTTFISTHKYCGNSVERRRERDDEKRTRGPNERSHLENAMEICDENVSHIKHTHTGGGLRHSKPSIRPIKSLIFVDCRRIVWNLSFSDSCYHYTQLNFTHWKKNGFDVDEMHTPYMRVWCTVASAVMLLPLLRALLSQRKIFSNFFPPLLLLLLWKMLFSTACPSK